MSVFTDLNLEQSIARYLADKLLEKGYAVYWHDTKRTEGSGLPFTLMREFPKDPTHLILPNQPLAPQKVRIPAFAVNASNTRTTPESRLGVGESVFEWTAEIRVYGLVDTEARWYEFTTNFKNWFGHPDIRIDICDYEADLKNPTPPVVSEKVQFTNVDIYKDKLSTEHPAATHYFVQLAATANFAE